MERHIDEDFRRVESGKRIRELRKELGLPKQFNLSEILHVKRELVTKWETGKVRPSMDNYLNLYEIFKPLNVSLDYIMGLSDYRRPENADVGSEIGLSEKSIEVLRRFQAEYQPIFRDNLKGLNFILETLSEEYEDMTSFRDCNSILASIYKYTHIKEYWYSLDPLRFAQVATNTNYMDIFYYIQKSVVDRFLYDNENRVSEKDMNITIQKGYELNRQMKQIIEKYAETDIFDMDFTPDTIQSVLSDVRNKCTDEEWEVLTSWQV